MGLSFGSSPILLIFLFLLLAALSYFVYRRTTPDLSAPKKTVLGALRFLAIALIAFLLFRPEFLSRTTDRENPVVAVLIDESESMASSLSDSASSDNMTAIRELVASLSDDADVKVYTFGSEARPINSSLDSVTFGAQRTNIADALQQVGDESAADNLTSVVLISDGRYNTGPNPVYAAERFPVPVTTVTVGDTTEFRDIYIQRVNTNELAYVGVTLPVEISVQANGFRGSSVAVALVDDQGTLVDNENIVLPGAGEELIVPLEVTPDAEGLLRLRAVVTRVDGETTFRNNSVPLDVRVLKSQKQILVVGARPGPDVSLVQQLISRSDNLSATTYIQKNSSTFYEGAFTARADTFDLAILVGFPGRGVDGAAMAEIARAAGGGLPILYIYQRRSNLTALSSALQGRLPVVLQTERSGLVEAQPVLTFQAGQHAITRDLPYQQGDYSRLPPLQMSDSRLVPAPGSVNLFESTVRGIELKDPVVSVLGRPDFRTAVIMGEGLWRWHNLPEDAASMDNFLTQLFDNTTTWLTAGSDERLVRVEPVETLFGGGETIQLQGQVYDESLNPVSDAAVEVVVTGPDRRELPYIMDNSGSGRYLLEIGSLPEGAYTYRATATAGDRSIGIDEGGFNVGRLALEYRNTSADPVTMRQISVRSGGLSTNLAEISQIPGALREAGAYTERVVDSESSLRLWQQYPFLILITALLTIEWFIRKRSGLV